MTFQEEVHAYDLQTACFLHCVLIVGKTLVSFLYESVAAAAIVLGPGSAWSAGCIAAAVYNTLYTLYTLPGVLLSFALCGGFGSNVLVLHFLSLITSCDWSCTEV